MTAVRGSFRAEKNPIIFLVSQSGFWFNTLTPDFWAKSMVLLGSMSGRLLGKLIAGIIVTVVHVVVEGRQVALNERQFFDSVWVEAAPQL